MHLGSDRHLDIRGPIGVFDSGVGGLSVWREIVRQLPNERTIYVADQAHVPYGPRSQSEIREFSEAITDLLLRQGAKLIVVACNTASGAALEHLRATYSGVPFVGMEPAVKPAAEQTQSGVVGVLATPTTYEGHLFKRLVQRFSQKVEIHSQVCPGLVEAVEDNRIAAPETAERLRACLAPLLAVGIDQLVLGCTHYPFLRQPIEAIVGPGVKIIDPAPAVARQTGRVLKRQGLVSSSPAALEHAFYTSGSRERLSALAEVLVGHRGAVQEAVWTGHQLRIA